MTRFQQSLPERRIVIIIIIINIITLARLIYVCVFVGCEAIKLKLKGGTKSYLSYGNGTDGDDDAGGCFRLSAELSMGRRGRRQESK